MTDLILLKNWLETTIELWKPIEGFKGYEVSNQGRVRSFWRTSGSGRSCVNGKIRGKWTQIIGTVPRLLKPCVDKDGYHRQALRANGAVHRCGVHRLVANAFIFNERPDIATIPNHINNVKNDNRVSNLNWMTVAENTLYGNEYGNGGRGERHGMARLTVNDVLHIRATCQTLAECKTAAVKYNCTHQNIQRIIQRKTWAHL